MNLKFQVRSKSYSKVQSTCQKLDPKRITDQARWYLDVMVSES